MNARKRNTVSPRMHPDEREVTDALAARVVGSQLPQWADLPLVPVASSGTSNALFRLGDDLCVRMPRNPWAAEQLAKEQAWLPTLAGRTSLAVPEQVAVGEPTNEFPWTWSVVGWLPGRTADTMPARDLRRSATHLAQFINDLRAVDPTGGPTPGRHNVFRGVPLIDRDPATRRGIVAMGEMIDIELARRVWEDALAAPPWDRPGEWIHGDLQPANVLVADERITGVIDFGCLGVGDPACDLLAAWAVFDADGRDHFRAALDVDHATWRRGRGWALSFGAMVYPHYRTTNPTLAELAAAAITQSLLDAP